MIETKKKRELTGATLATIAHLDVNASFGLRTESVLRRCVDTGIELSRDHLHAAELRTRTGAVSLMTYLEVSVEPLPVAVGQLLDVRCRLRFLRAGGDNASLMRELDFELCTPEGIADRARIRDVCSPLPRRVARARLVTQDVRPSAPREDKLVRELPPELSHYQVHERATAVPELQDLLQLPPHGSFDLGPWESREDVWPLEATDVNGLVCTARYVSEIDAQYARCRLAAGWSSVGPRTRRVQVLFKRPFTSGESFHVCGRLSEQDSSGVAAITLHAVRDDSSRDPRPAVAARFTEHAI